MEDFKRDIKSLYADISGPVLRDALHAGAEIFRGAIERSAPSRTGKARANVIVYQRKPKGLSQGAGELSLLVGFEKHNAYYVYFYEHGTKRQGAKPFIEAAFNGARDAALRVVSEVVKLGVEKA